MSLGIDPISTEKKVCNFDCIYCQLGNEGILSNERKVFVDTDSIIREIDMFPAKDIDYYTFSGRGEPTLAKNLGEMISAVKKDSNRKVAVITNSALIYDDNVRRELALSDLVIAKLDASDDSSLNQISRPTEGVEFNSIVEGLKEFRKMFKGKLALQVMFVEKNKFLAPEIAELAKKIDPDEVQINTPLRPSGEKPLDENDMEEIKSQFSGLNIISVFNAKKVEFSPICEQNTVLRHGKYKEV
ncbi:MAG: radical SAM protein [Candidatus Omnitrophica bacterium]|nr:radical SAM protein [Candidatus Omnitrophota bacterium]MBU4334460.1 radical SAM protein [Candidatus Omnitrophota bacterium]